MNPDRIAAVKVAGTYAFIGSLWILLSSRVAMVIAPSPRYLEALEIAKGWFFIVFTAALLYAMVLRSMRALTKSEREARTARTRTDLALRMARTAIWEWEIGSDHIGLSPNIDDVLRQGDRHLGGNIKSLTELVSPLEFDRGLKDLQDRVAQGQPVEAVLPYAAGNGDKRWLELRADAIRDESGNPVSVIGTCVDVTSRVEMEVQLAELRHSLEHRVADRTRDLQLANAELESFTHTVAHDLRSPLRRINGFARSLEMDLGDARTPAIEDSLARIHRAVMKMSGLIDDLLALSRVARISVTKRKVDVTLVANELLAEIRERDLSRPLAVDVEAGLRVHADEHLLRVVLQNLLENAWKFTLESEAPMISVGSAQTSSGPAIVVRDNGIGFDPKYASSMFEPFKRFVSDERYPGTGIGLATVKRVIERHGGTVWAEGQVGEGASIYVCFPTEPSTSSAQ